MHACRNTLLSQCVRVRACRNPRRDREEMGWRLFPDQDVTPATKTHQSTHKTRTRHAHAKCFVLDHPVSRPHKICTHVQTCHRDARRRRTHSRMQPAACSNACSGTGACVSGAAACVSDAAAAPEATLDSRTQTRRTKRTRHAHNARPALLCAMRAVCQLTPA